MRPGVTNQEATPKGKVSYYIKASVRAHQGESSLFHKLPLIVTQSHDVKMNQALVDDARINRNLCVSAGICTLSANFQKNIFSQTESARAFV